MITDVERLKHASNRRSKLIIVIFCGRHSFPAKYSSFIILTDETNDYGTHVYKFRKIEYVWKKQDYLHVPPNMIFSNIILYTYAKRSRINT